MTISLRKIDGHTWDCHPQEFEQGRVAVVGQEGGDHVAEHVEGCGAGERSGANQQCDEIFDGHAVKLYHRTCVTTLN